jgi:hypothetical protein
MRRRHVVTATTAEKFIGWEVRIKGTRRRPGHRGRLLRVERENLGWVRLSLSTGPVTVPFYRGVELLSKPT